ncbi:MAG TPA: helix-turn-helix transcriptional regulator [Chloroflexota bacterium]|nr:helix-turn-helix transcriptional regulator [Chloroflexota bacterium]
MQELPVLDQSEIDGVDRCRCEGGQPKNFARPCLLLLLAESSAHGYELIERLRPFGFEINDPATVYKTLRQMQSESLVTSTWELSTRGPARRVYELTSDGRDLLESWAMTLDLNRAILGRFLDRYGQLDPGLPPEPRTGTRIVMSNSRGGKSA